MASSLLLFILTLVRGGIFDELSIDILDPNIAEYLTDQDVGYLRTVNSRLNEHLEPQYQQRLSLVDIYGYLILCFKYKHDLSSISCGIST